MTQGILILFLAAPLLLAARITAPFIFYQDMEGLWKDLEGLASLYPSDAILIFDDGPIGQRLPQVMELVFGKGSIAYLESPGPAETDRLEGVITHAIAEGRRVFLNVVDGNLLWEPKNLTLQSYAAYSVKTRRVTPERIPPPTAKSIAPMQFMVDIYEVVPRQGESAVARVEIPVGQGSYPYLKGGFHGVEFDAQGRPYRWTGDQAVIRIPVPQFAQRQTVDVEVTLLLGAWRPEGSPPTRVNVQVQGATLLETSIDHLFEPQTFRTVARQLFVCDEFLEIRLSSDTWTPADYGMVDRRSLGVILYGASVVFTKGS